MESKPQGIASLRLIQTVARGTIQFGRALSVMDRFFLVTKTVDKRRNITVMDFASCPLGSKRDSGVRRFDGD
jgi:hypothetical protein